MKTPRRSNKTQQSIEQQTAGIPVSDAKALFDAVSKDNTKTITLGAPTEVVRKAPIRALGEIEDSSHFSQLSSLVAATLPEQETQSTENAFVPGMSVEDNLNAAIDRAFEAAGLPSDVTTNQLVDQAVAQMEAEGTAMDALIEQSMAVMQQLMADVDVEPEIPGTIEMDIEQDDGTIKHHVFDNLDRPYHTTAMNYCDLLIQQYDRDKADRALQPPVKPLRMKLFGFL